MIPFTSPILSKTLYVEWAFNLPLQLLLYCGFCAGVLFDLLINKIILKSLQLTSSLSRLPNKNTNCQGTHPLPDVPNDTGCPHTHTHTLACLSSIKKMWECNKPQLVQQINADESFDSC